MSRSRPLTEAELAKMQVTPQRFGEIIKARRMALGWSKTQLAKAMGIDQQTITSWEDGRGDSTAYRLINFALGGAPSPDHINGSNAINEAFRRRALAAEKAMITIIGAIKTYRAMENDNRSDGVGRET